MVVDESDCYFGNEDDACLLVGLAVVAHRMLEDCDIAAFC